MGNRNNHSALWWQKMLLIGGLGAMFILSTGQEEPAATADCCMEDEEEEYIIFEPASATLKLNGSQDFSIRLKTGQRIRQYSAGARSNLLKEVDAIAGTLHVVAASESDLSEEDLIRYRAAVVLHEADPLVYVGTEIWDAWISFPLGGDADSLPGTWLDVSTISATNVPVRVAVVREDEKTVQGTVMVTIDPSEFKSGGMQ